MTGHGYIKYLSEDERIKFKRNIIIQRGVKKIKTYLNNEFDSFYDFIDCAFTWSRTKEGTDYWSEIAESL